MGDKVGTELKVTGTDNKGKTRSVTLVKARSLAPNVPIKKQESESTNILISNTEEDEIFANISSADQILAPPYNLRSLANMRDISTELGPCIDAVVTNVVGFGFQLRERAMPENLREKFKDEIEQERFMLEAKLSHVHPFKSLTNLRKMSLSDMHGTGSGYLELILNRNGDLAGVNHVHSHSIRITKKDKHATDIEVPVVRPDQDFEIEIVKMAYRFRRYAMRLQTGIVWFKEAGDPRRLNKSTGEFETEKEPVPDKDLATSLIRDFLYHPTTPYGVPLFMGNVINIRGSRSSEEINYNTMNSNAIPSAMIIVEGGVLTEGSIDRIKDWTEDQIQNTQNFSKFLLLEAEASEEGSLTPGNFKIRVEPMKRLQQNDEMFQKYDKNNKEKTRQAFRLPPMFVGRTAEYTRASADTSRVVADEQVFNPERVDLDYNINRFILASWGTRFHTFRSNTPNITDDTELIKLMAFGEKSGAITPRRADRIIKDVFGQDIGPMPTGLDLDKPFMLTFAEAQSKGSGGGTGGNSPGTTTVKKLMEMRDQIEDEFDRRFTQETDLKLDP